MSLTMTFTCWQKSDLDRRRLDLRDQHGLVLAICGAERRRVKELFRFSRLRTSTLLVKDVLNSLVSLVSSNQTPKEQT